MATPLQTLARTRIATWIKSTGRTQADVAREIGKKQNWLSRYLGGKTDADVDTLQQLAAVFGHSLASLLQVNADPDEGALIEAFRALRGSARPTAIAAVQEMGGTRPHPPTGGSRTRTRSQK